SFGSSWLPNPPALFQNGIHLTEFGYWRYASALERGLGFEDRDWLISINVKDKKAKVSGNRVKVEKLELAPLRFIARETILPDTWPHQRTVRPLRMIGFFGPR